MLEHVLDQTAALPRRYKCQRDEGEDSNAVLSLLHCLVDTKGGSRCDECPAETDTFLPVFTCLWREMGAIYLAGGGGGGQAI